MNKGINLLEVEKKKSFTPASQRLNVLRVTAVGLLFIISTVSVMLFFLIIISPLPALQTQEQNLLAKLSQFHPDIAKLFLVEDRLKTTQTILAKREHFDDSLARIKNKMPSDLAITALTMNKEKISITVLSSSLASLDDFLNNLVAASDNKKDFSKVTLINLFTDQINNKFTLTVEVVAL